MWRVWVRRGGRIWCWWGNRRERGHWGDPGVDEDGCPGVGMWACGLDWVGPG